MPAIECNGIQLAYEERGDGDPPFLFVHGWTCDRSFFAPQAEHFARNHRVVSVDLRGHGESDKPEGDYPISAFASDLAAFLEQLNAGKVIAVGHSMGALAVLQLAADYPELVSAIVTVDPAPMVIPPEAKERLEGLVKASRSGDQTARKATIDNFFLPTSDKTLWAEVKQKMLATPDHVAAAAMQGIVDFEGAAVAAKVRVPVLNIAATQPLSPPPQVREWIPHVISGQTVGTGHFNHMESPEQVNAMIESFLRHHV